MEVCACMCLGDALLVISSCSLHRCSVCHIDWSFAFFRDRMKPSEKGWVSLMPLLASHVQTSRQGNSKSSKLRDNNPYDHFLFMSKPGFV